ncbi:MAG: septum formation initiator family protein [Halanaerobiales bacterium]|nr:septum formation initiator family protein [Halanaerobiales bacterium]
MKVNRHAHYKYDANRFINRKQENSIKIKKHKEKPFGLKAISTVFFVFIIGFIIILYVNQFAKISTTNYQIKKLEKEIAKLKLENEKIEFKISQSQNLKLIDQKAKDFGMVVPDTSIYVTLNQDSKKQTEASESLKEDNKIVHLASEVAVWFKNLTSVEAGTLDE